MTLLFIYDKYQKQMQFLITCLLLIIFISFSRPIRERTFRLWRCLGPESLVVSSQQLLEARRTTLPQVAPRLGQPSLWLSPRPHIDRLKMDKEIRYSNGKIEISNSSIGGGSSFGLPGEQPRRQPRKAFGQQQQQQQQMCSARR
jgi:hypothetical protein